MEKCKLFPVQFTQHCEESLQLKHSAGKLCKLSLSVLLQASSLCILSLSGTTCSVIAIIG